MARPKRTFQANVGQPSVGSAGPDQIEYDLDNLFAMFDPNETLRDGTTQGGITKDNVRSGIATLDDNGKLPKTTIEGDPFNATTGHKHTGAAGDAPKLTPAAFDTFQWPAFRAYPNAQQNLTANTWTKIAYNAEDYDQGNVYDSASYRFIVPETGFYLFSASIGFSSGTDGTKRSLALYVNGIMRAYLAEEISGAATAVSISGSTILRLSANDYVEVFAYTTTNEQTGTPSNVYSYFTAIRLA